MNSTRPTDLAAIANPQNKPGYWVWAIPILLVVAALAFRQIDVFPPTTDEFFSMYNAGWLANGPFSPEQVVQSLRKHSPDHTPLYFVMLSFWGKFAGTSLAAGRTLTVLISMLSVAAAYRLAADFVSPVAGVLAIVVLTSSAFYNFYISNVRMYPLLVASAGALLWVYLRLAHRVKTVKATDYFALALATFFLISTHAFSAIFMVMLGAYHLLFAPKTRRWIWISAAVLTAIILFSPFLLLLLEEIGSVIEGKAIVAVGGADAVSIWLRVASNNQPLLLLISLAGLAVGAWKRKIVPRPYHLMFLLYLLAMALLAHFTTLVIKDSMRYHLAGWLPFLLFVVAGLYGFFRFRRWLGLLVLLWLIAGSNFQTSVNWWHYIVLRALVFAQPPTHIISRVALQAEPKPAIIGYPYDEFYAPFALEHRGNINYSQRDYYFGRHGLSMDATDGPDTFEDYVRRHAIDSPSLWLVHPESDKYAARVDQAKAVLHGLHYQACDSQAIGYRAVIVKLMWTLLDCQIPQSLAKFQTAIVDYHFHSAALDKEGNKLLFVDKWSARAETVELEDYSMSYQLLREQWDNVAQLDLPMVHPGKLRQFSIDILGVEAGRYWLMAILYNKRTRERFEWLNNSGNVAEMQTLAEIVIS